MNELDNAIDMLTCCHCGANKNAEEMDFDLNERFYVDYAYCPDCVDSIPKKENPYLPGISL